MAPKSANRKNSTPTAKTNVNVSPSDALVAQRKDEILALAKSAPDKIRPYLEQYAGQVGQFEVFIELTVLPLIFVAIEQCRQLVIKLEPYWTEGNLADIIPAILGFFLVFFGGEFPLLIAAVEAFRLTGYTGVKDAIAELFGEGKKAWEAHIKDEQKDDDGDGVPDNKQISADARMKRKALLCLKVVDPSRVDHACRQFAVGWVAVLASLKMTFARTITLGVSISEMMNKVVSRSVVPAVENMCPQEYRKWVPIIISYVVNAIAVSIAWTIQRVISAFHSALRGGQLFGTGVVKFAHRKGYIQFDAEDSYLDETVGYALAGVGFLWQLASGFSLPLPLSLLLFPVTIGEYVLEYVVTML